MADTFWLDVSSEIQHTLMLVGVVMFLTIPNQGKKDFLELGLFISITFIIETIADVLWYVFKSNQINIVNTIFTIVPFLLFVLLYRRRANWKKANTISLFIIAVFLLYSIINFIFIQGPDKINSYTKTLAGVTTIIICIAYFYSLIKELPTESITTLPMFWITSAFLISRSASFFINLSTDYLVNVVGDNLVGTSYINYFFGVIFYSMLSYAMYLIRIQYNRVYPIS